MPYHRWVYLCWFPVPREPNHPCPTDTPVTIGKQEIISYKHKSGGTCYHIDSMCIYNRLPLSRACWEPKFVSVNYVVLPLSRAFGRRPRLATFWSKDPHWRLQLPNSMLSDNRRTYVSGISAHIDIALATDHNKQISYLITHATKLSNHTLCKATHDGFCVEISQTVSLLDRSRIAFQITPISTFST